MKLTFTRAGLIEAALVAWIAYAAAAMALRSQRDGMEFPGFHRATPIGSEIC